MEQDTESIKEQMAEYREQIAPLIRYIPWFEEKAGSAAATMYKGEGSESGLLSFPVYDSTLMSFVKLASASPLIDRNYMYVYTRKGIRTPEDERRLIESADARTFDNLRGILSRYICGGRTKAVLWSQGVSEQIFYLTLKKMKEIVDFYDSDKNV